MTLEPTPEPTLELPSQFLRPTPLSAEEVRRLVEAGAAAPSADNRHIVRFEPSGASLRLRVDAALLALEAPHRIVFHELSLGAVIENLVLAAGAMGRCALVRMHSDWRDAGVVADIDFAAEDPGADRDADSLRAAIFERCTNRRMFARSRRAPDAVLEALERAASPGADVRVHWLDDDHARSRALALVFRAERERFRSRRLHTELFDAIRFDVGWKGPAETGLAPGSLEVEPPLRAVFRALRHWPLQRTANYLGAAQVLAARAAWLPAWTAPHLVLFSASLDAAEVRISAGRAFQRFWLAATRNGLALQPLGASVALALQPPDNAWASASVCRSVRDGLVSVAGGRLPLMLARLGYAPPPTVRAGRPPAAALLV